MAPANLSDVVREVHNLVTPDYSVVEEHPGCVVIRRNTGVANFAWWFGTTNADWCGDLVDEVTGEVMKSVVCDAPSSDHDAKRVARCIVKAFLPGHA